MSCVASDLGVKVVDEQGSVDPEVREKRPVWADSAAEPTGEREVVPLIFVTESFDVKSGMTFGPKAPNIANAHEANAMSPLER